MNKIVSDILKPKENGLIMLKDEKKLFPIIDPIALSSFNFRK